MNENSVGPVWIGDRLVDNDQGTIPLTDRSYLSGHGVFEAIEISEGRPFALAEHLDRLERSAHSVGLGVPPRPLIEGAIASLWSRLEDLHPRAFAHAVARVTLSDDGPDHPPRLVVTWRPWPDRSQPAKVTTSRWRRNERGALAGVKSTSYGENLVALADARAQGADEAILLNTLDELCEATMSNVFVVIAGKLLTPPTSSGLLAGVTRGLLLSAGVGREETIGRARLEDITEAFLTSTTRHVQPITEWDGRRLATDGVRTLAARTAWTDLRQGFNR